MPRGESPYDASIAAGEAGEAVSAESLSQDPVVSREQSQDVKTRREDRCCSLGGVGDREQVQAAWGPGLGSTLCKESGGAHGLSCFLVDHPFPSLSAPHLCSGGSLQL